MKCRGRARALTRWPFLAALQAGAPNACNSFIQTALLVFPAWSGSILLILCCSSWGTLFPLVSCTASYGDTGVSIDNINVKTQLLPSSLKYAGYDGSLTTPGCDERVKWHVFTTPREVTREQMKLFVDVTMGAHAGADVVNNRMIQDLGDREVYKYNY
eukprot:661815-Pelagomonas_calceolata.AAC.4